MSSTSSEPCKEPSGHNYTNCLYCKWDKLHPSEQRRPLTEGRNCDERPIWEPPIFCYSELIDEVHDKKRGALLKHFDNDRAKTTQFMDIDTEYELLYMYKIWLEANEYDAEVRGDLEGGGWFDTLWDEVLIDQKEVEFEWRKKDMKLEKRGDGEWIVRKRIYGHYEGEKWIQYHYEGETPPPSKPKDDYFSAVGPQPLAFNFLDPTTDLSSWSLDNTFITHQPVFNFFDPATAVDLSHWSLEDTFISHTAVTSDTDELPIDRSATGSHPDSASDSEGPGTPEPVAHDLFTLWS